MKKNPIFAFIIVLAVIAVLVLVIYGVWQTGAKKESLPPTMEQVVIGMEPNQVNSLIIIADDQDFFTANGINVTIRNYPSGAAAMEGLTSGESNIATATEFVLVGKAIMNTPVSTFASIDRFQQIHVLGRKDRGIENISDLKGKRIGVPKKTAGEFYLGRFLLLHGMGMRDVALVNVPPQQSADAITNGSVDAIVAWQPNVRTIESRLMNGTVTWPAQSGQDAYCIVIATDNWTSAHPDTIDRFVKAIRQSESYIDRHPDEARTIVQRRLKYDKEFMGMIWQEHQFSLSLDQSLITAMEDEARWMITNNLTNVTAIPDFRNYIYTKGLNTVKPESVNIIGMTRVP
jgi:NitT/TauT family transport system substrate-binding protein